MTKIIFSKKRLGSALIVSVLVTAFITGIVAFSASKIFGSSFSTLGMFMTNTIVESYAAGQIAQYREMDGNSIASHERQPVEGSLNLSESISTEDIGDMRYITLKIFHGNEVEPRVEYTLRKSLSSSNQDAKPIYQNSGSNINGAMSQKAMTDTFLQKADAVTRVERQAVGSARQGVYMGKSVVAADNILRLEQRDSSNNLGAITEETAANGHTVKHIDYFDKSFLMDQIQVTGEDNTKNGYIRIGKNLIFAWKDASLNNELKYTTINKPYEFKTLYSGIFDFTTTDKPSEMTGVWANMRTSDSADVYYTDSLQANETANIFWFGYTGDEELPAIPVPMRKLDVANVPNQQIVVRVEDIYGTFYTLTNGQSGNYPEGSSFSVTVNPAAHYIAGIPTPSAGFIYTDTSINASAAILQKHSFTVANTENQTITVTARDAQTGQTVNITNGQSINLSYGSTWTATIDPAFGYNAGTLSATSGTVTGETTVSATAAVVKSRTLSVSFRVNYNYYSTEHGGTVWTNSVNTSVGPYTVTSPYTSSISGYGYKITPTPTSVVYKNHGSSRTLHLVNDSRAGQVWGTIPWTEYGNTDHKVTLEITGPY